MNEIKKTIHENMDDNDLESSIQNPQDKIDFVLPEKSKRVGKPHTIESRRKISKSKSGKLRAQDMKDRILKARMDKIHARSRSYEDDTSIVYNPNDECKIYKLTNTVNGKIYIGQTWMDYKKRMGADGKRYSNSTFLYNAILKYGSDNFAYETLDTAKHQEDADELEMMYIEQYDSCNPSIGYNLKAGGFAGKHSQVTKDKISNSLKGEKAPWYGKKLSQETKDKIAKANSGWECTDELREKFVNAAIKRHKDYPHPMQGKTHTEEAKEKISKASKALWENTDYAAAASAERKTRRHTDEAKANMSKAQMGNKNNLGKKRSQESKDRMSKLMKEKYASGPKIIGKVPSPEGIARISEAKKAYWDKWRLEKAERLAREAAEKDGNDTTTMTHIDSID